MRWFFVVMAVLFAGCHQPPTGIAELQGGGDNLTRDSFVVQADDLGQVEFEIQDHDMTTGIPLIQTYEVSPAKFSKVLMFWVPHTLDVFGVVRTSTAPDCWVVVVVVK